MSIRVIDLLKDYGIEHTTTHHHCTEGWVNIHCPFCEGHKNFHLGIHLKSGACHCWRCGAHSLVDTIAAVLDISKPKAARIIRSYSEVDLEDHRKLLTRPKISEVKLPSPLMDLTDKHKAFLRRRGFNPDFLIRTYGLKSIGPGGPYRYRLFIPIIYQGQVVSFTTRAVTDDPDVVRYKTCSKDNEVIHHKYIVYGFDLIPDDTVIVVEGPSDAWRLGPGAVATFGITYTFPQVMLLSKIKNVFIMFDNEPLAQQQAEKLAHDIELLSNRDVHIISGYDASDPGSLKERDVKLIWREVRSVA